MFTALAAIALATAPVAPASIYDFALPNIEGKETKLSEFRGKVLLVVNVASRCGLTPQYAGLEKLYREHKDAGLVVLGFPANNFAGQEPGTNEEIAQFCKAKYDVSFPMFSKLSVNGDDRHPLYAWLIQSSERKEDIEWNFAKFLVGRDGQVKARFSPRVAPDAPELIEAVKAELAKG